MRGEGAKITGSAFLLALYRLEVEVVSKHRALVWVIELTALRQPAALPPDDPAAASAPGAAGFGLRRICELPFARRVSRTEREDGVGRLAMSEACV